MLNYRVGFRVSPLVFVFGLVLGCQKTTTRKGACRGASSAQNLRFLAENTSDSAENLQLGLPAAVSVPRLLGGVLEFQKFASTEQVVFSHKIDNEKTVRGRCSAVFEFVKEDGKSKVNAFLSNYCIMADLSFRGKAPVIQVYRPASEGLMAGYEAIKVKWDRLELRDALLEKLFAIPNLNNRAFAAALMEGIDFDRIVNTRRGINRDTEKRGNRALLAPLCLEVPASVMAEWESLPPDKRGLEPLESSDPSPRACQFLADGQWFSFEVDDPVSEKSGKVDSFIAKTAEYAAYQKAKSKLTPEMTERLEQLRILGRETDAKAMKWKRGRLENFVINASCDEGTPEGPKVHCGPNNDKIYEAYRTTILADRGQELADRRALPASPEKAQATRDWVTSRYFDFLDTNLAYATLLEKVQADMKANPALVGIATNHVKNLDAKTFQVAFKELPLFPVSLKREPELSKHDISFAKTWLEISLPKEKAHPLINNLTTEIHNGYALTFAGVPVGAVMPQTDQSGGASVINLPERKKQVDAKKKDGSYSGSESDAERSDGC
jgi:hypothetical protein